MSAQQRPRAVTRAEFDQLKNQVYVLMADEEDRRESRIVGWLTAGILAGAAVLTFAAIGATALITGGSL